MEIKVPIDEVLRTFKLPGRESSCWGKSLGWARPRGWTRAVSLALAPSGHRRSRCPKRRSLRCRRTWEARTKALEPVTQKKALRWRTLTLCGAPERIRTSDLCLRRAALYPAELRALKSNCMSYGYSCAALRAAAREDCSGLPALRPFGARLWRSKIAPGDFVEPLTSASGGQRSIPLHPEGHKSYGRLNRIVSLCCYSVMQRFAPLPPEAGSDRDRGCRLCLTGMLRRCRITGLFPYVHIWLWWRCPASQGRRAGYTLCQYKKRLCFLGIFFSIGPTAPSRRRRADIVRPPG